MTARRPDLQALQDSTLVRARANLGDFELTVCSDGIYLLDGGAMFGVVPKDAVAEAHCGGRDNRIRLGLNSLVVRTGRHTV